MASPTFGMHGFPPEAIGNRVENKYLCGYCQQVLRNPVQSFCGHRYCRVCVDQLLKGVTSVKCQPCMQECNEEEDITKESLFPDNATKRELSELPANCPNEECEWTGTLKGLENHELGCKFYKEKCECGGLFFVEQFAAHRQNACTYRLVTCQHCNAIVQSRSFLAHTAMCPLVPVACPRCGEQGILRRDLSSHMADQTCKLRVRCPYGCGVMVEETLMDDHMKLQVRAHMDAVIAKIQTLSDRMDEQISQVQDAVHVLSTASVTEAGEEAGGGATGGGATGGGAGDGASDLHEQLDSLDQKVNLHENVSIVLKREIQKVTRNIVKFDDGRASDHDRIVALEEKVAMLLSDGVAASGSASASMCSYASASASASASAFASASAESQNELVSSDGRLLWKIKDFLAKKREAASGGPPMLTSRPFLTSSDGYKLCARIYPNGDGVGRNEYLSVFIVVMRGPNDASLKWPFRQKIVIALLDQSPHKNHIVDSFRPDPASVSFQQPTSALNMASGCPMFASHATIGQVGEFQYIKDGELILRVTVMSEKVAKK